MAHLELTVDIQAPAEQVWNGVTNWSAQGKWMMATKVESLDGQGHQVGARISAFTGVGRLGILDTMTITAWNPPASCSVLHTGKIVRGTGDFSVVPIHSQAAKFIWAEDLEIPLGIIGKIGFALVKPFFLLGIKRSLGKFAHLVEIGQI
jgi:hypothetical protein